MTGELCHMLYGGDLTPKQCWTLLDSESATLIDVRTNAEWAYVGMPELASHMNPLVGQQWQTLPHMEVDGDFVGNLQSKLGQLGVKKDGKLCFICKTGGRSRAAAMAMTAAGYPNSYNVTHGFDGDADDKGHRGTINGWKADDLPWRQQ